MPARSSARRTTVRQARAIVESMEMARHRTYRKSIAIARTTTALTHLGRRTAGNGNLRNLVGDDTQISAQAKPFNYLCRMFAFDLAIDDCRGSDRAAADLGAQMVATGTETIGAELGT
jgi:hypothetical protein